MEELQHKVLKYKTYLETNQDGGKILHIFNKLLEMPITVNILQNTGIGKIVNGFRKKNGEIGKIAKVIVSTWKHLVAEEQLRLETENEALELSNQNNSDEYSPTNQEEDVDSSSEKEADIVDSHMNQKDDKFEEEYTRNQKCRNSDKIEQQADKENIKKCQSGDRKDKEYRHSEKRDRHQEHFDRDRRKEKHNDRSRETSDSHGSHSDKQTGHSHKHSHSEKHVSHSSHSDKHISHSDKYSSHSDKHNHSDKHVSHSDKYSSHSHKHSSHSDKHSKHSDRKRHELEKGVKKKESDGENEIDQDEVDSHISKGDKYVESESRKHSSSENRKSENKSGSESRKHSSSENRKSENKSESESRKHSSSENRKSENKSESESGKHSSSENRKSENKSERESRKHSSSENRKSENKSESESRKHSSSETRKGENKQERNHSSSEYRKDEKHSEGERKEKKHSSSDNKKHEKNSMEENRKSSKQSESKSRKHESYSEDKRKSQEKSESESKRHTKSESVKLDLDNELENGISESDENFDSEMHSPSERNIFDTFIEDRNSADKKTENKVKEIREKEHKQIHHDDLVTETHSTSSHYSSHKNKAEHDKNSKEKSSHSNHHRSKSDSSRSHSSHHRSKTDKEKETSSRPDLNHIESSSKEEQNKKRSHSEKTSSKQTSENKESSRPHVKDSSRSSKHVSSEDKSRSHKSGEKSKSKHSDEKRSHSSKSDKKDTKRKHGSSINRGESSKSKKPEVEFLAFDESDVVKKTVVREDYEKLKAKFKIKKKGEPSQKLLAPSKEFPVVKRKNADQDSPLASSSKAPRLETSDDPFALPAPQTHYRPWRFSELDEQKNAANDFDDGAIWTKNYTRTQVYSGKKQQSVPEVYRLYDICLQVLMNNIDNLDYVGGVPYDIMKPVLDKCTPTQLYRLEDSNPVFLEDTDGIWQKHCDKEFKLEKPEEFESWREMYWRKSDERQEKFQSLKSSISASMAQKVPVKTTKLAYVDSAAKPPREVRRQQLKYGTAGSSSGERSKKFSHMLEPVAISRPTNAKRVAPMMQKTLTMIKKIRK